jgi:hypothetical protein
MKRIDRLEQIDPGAYAAYRRAWTVTYGGQEYIHDLPSRPWIIFFYRNKIVPRLFPIFVTAHFQSFHPARAESPFLFYLWVKRRHEHFPVMMILTGKSQTAR